MLLGEHASKKNRSSKASWNRITKHSWVPDRSPWTEPPGQRSPPLLARNRGLESIIVAPGKSDSICAAELCKSGIRDRAQGAGKNRRPGRDRLYFPGGSLSFQS